MKTQIDLYKGLGGYGTLGLEIVLSFLIGLFGGRWLDDRYGTSPWCFFGGVALGIVLSVKAITRAMRLMRQVAEREEREYGNPKPLFESSSERDRRKGDLRTDDPVILAPDEDATDGDTRDAAHDDSDEEKNDEAKR